MRFTLSAAIISGALVLSGSTAFAADLLLVPEPIAEVAPGWADGIYAGVHAGYGFGMADHQPAAPVGPGGLGNDISSMAGPLVGAQVGGWWHITNGIMGGFQLDGSWANISGSVAIGPNTFTHTVNWLATAEGRLGFDAGGFVPYVSLGVAAAGATRTATATASMVHTGFSLGAGAQFMITDQISADIEGRWQGFQPQSYTTGGFPPSVALSVTTIRAGLNFHF
jgi:opacity protein-like surface antigen